MIRRSSKSRRGSSKPRENLAVNRTDEEPTTQAKPDALRLGVRQGMIYMQSRIRQGKQLMGELEATIKWAKTIREHPQASISEKVEAGRLILACTRDLDRLAIAQESAERANAAPGAGMTTGVSGGVAVGTALDEEPGGAAVLVAIKLRTT